MMSKVELNDVSDQFIRIGIYGLKAEKYLREAGFNVPSETNMVTETNTLQLIRLAGSTPRFECIGSLEAIKNLWQTLKNQAQLLNTSHWRLLDIQAGIPNIFIQTNETFIPQMLNLQALNGINFKKGCYTGQEIIARMQYLGKLKRRMYYAHCDTDTTKTPLPKPGVTLYSKNSKSGQGAGNIVDAQISPTGGIDLLAVITTDAAESNDIFLDDTFNIALILHKLPYTIETE